jgi:hypothetical protein
MDHLPVDVVDGIAWLRTSALTLGPPRGTPTTAPMGPFCT